LARVPLKRLHSRNVHLPSGASKLVSYSFYT
jgi:hypothetical protein